MESLVQFIKENLLNKKNYKYFPKTKEKLKSIIKKRIKEDGNEVDLNDIDVSKITDMSDLFYSNFNGNISKWDVSNVTSMDSMFYKCEQFDQNISNWDVSSVKNMNRMFLGCKSFNQNLYDWDVSSDKNIDNIFKFCKIKIKYRPVFI